MSDADNGPFRDLPGTWIGDGIAIVTGPGEQTDISRAPHVTITREAIAFAEVRGLGERTRHSPGGFSGVYYAHHRTDTASGSPLPTESGMWLTASDANVLRLATLAGEHPVLATGTWATLPGAPEIPGADLAPIDLATGRALPAQTSRAPGETEQHGGAGADTPTDPNAALRERASGQSIATTTTLTADGEPGLAERLRDIPFNVRNPDSLHLSASYWIETVLDHTRATGEFRQLQYSQTVTLCIDGIGWPCVSAATLIKQ